MARGKGNQMQQPDKRVRATALRVSGLQALVEVRRHPSARRLTLRVSQTSHTVVVTVPARCKIDEAGLFVHRNIEWVRDRLGQLPAPVPFAHDARIPLRGTVQRIQFSGPKRSGPIVACNDTGAGPVLDVKGDAEHAPRRLRDWLFAEARADLDARVAVHCERLQLTARRITVRDQSSRWGSCSASGMLSFSWRLILAPPIVLDYVAAHEVAHLAEMNHGPRFWALVARSMPDMDTARRWLRTHGNDLHRYGTLPGQAHGIAA